MHSSLFGFLISRGARRCCPPPPPSPPLLRELRGHLVPELGLVGLHVGDGGADVLLHAGGAVRLRAAVPNHFWSQNWKNGP